MSLPGSCMSQSVGVPESGDIPGRRQCETRTAPSEATAQLAHRFPSSMPTSASLRRLLPSLRTTVRGCAVAVTKAWAVPEQVATPCSAATGKAGYDDKKSGHWRSAVGSSIIRRRADAPGGRRKIGIGYRVFLSDRARATPVGHWSTTLLWRTDQSPPVVSGWSADRTFRSRRFHRAGHRLLLA